MERTEIRNRVFERDNFRCVFCGNKAVDAHHLLERRLWPDGGYLMDNLISVCSFCHLRCEMTYDGYSPEDGRKAAGITNVVVPQHMYADQVYDKWGNPVLSSGARLPGELFYDESVQRILKEGRALDLFTKYYKYPRTYHLPWSHPNRDDRVISNFKKFEESNDIVVTEKLDGENTTMYNDHIHARSIDGSSHPSRGWVKNFWSQIAHDIPDGFRICGENMYARHSIHYDDLDTYFYGISMWDRDLCLSWDVTLEWFDLLGITPVPTLYRGPWDVKAIDDLWFDEDVTEGYVVRVAEQFFYKDFKDCVAKYVRYGHVQTKERWETQWVKNGLKRE